MTLQQAEKAVRILQEDECWARARKSRDAWDCGGYVVDSDAQHAPFFHLWEVTDPLPMETAYGPYNDADSGL